MLAVEAAAGTHWCKESKDLILFVTWHGAGMKRQLTRGTHRIKG